MRGRDPPSDGRGPLLLSSITCSASSFDHAIVAVLELVRQLAGRGLEQLVGGRRDVQALAVDDHVLELDAEPSNRLRAAARQRRSGGGFELLAGIDACAQPFMMRS